MKFPSGFLTHDVPNTPRHRSLLSRITNKTPRNRPLLSRIAILRLFFGVFAADMGVSSIAADTQLTPSIAISRDFGVLFSRPFFARRIELTPRVPLSRAFRARFVRAQKRHSRCRLDFGGPVCVLGRCAVACKAALPVGGDPTPTQHIHTHTHTKRTAIL